MQERTHPADSLLAACCCPAPPVAQTGGLQGGTKETASAAAAGSSSSMLSVWGEWELHRLVAHFLAARFPIMLALNKVGVVVG